MIKSIGIRREDKSIWEKRVPLTPKHVEELIKKYNIKVKLQPSNIRCFKDEEYLKLGAEIKEDLSDCDFLIGVKEMKIDFIQPNKPHLFFSHTIKGQPYNMPMLKDILEKKATLLDYERMVDENNRRIIAFGKFAGLAGAIDTLAILGRKLKERDNIDTPLLKIKFAHEYENVEQAKNSIKALYDEFKNMETPLIIGVAGYGNVSQGVQEILKLLPLKKIEPKELENTKEKLGYIIFKEEHMVVPKENSYKFELQDYYNNPNKYKGIFKKYLPYLDVLINTIYWDERYPRLVTFESLEKLYSSNNPRLKVIGDISCDIKGAIECTYKATEPDNPAFTYDPINKKYEDGWKSNGVTVLAVDILPSEFSTDASIFFGDKLMNILPDIIKANFDTNDINQSGLPNYLKTSVIVWKGELTAPYKYLQNYIK